MSDGDLFDGNGTVDDVERIRRFLVGNPLYRNTEFRDPGESEPNARAYMRRDTVGRWHVLAVFADRPAIAYVTLPGEQQPHHPDQILWYWTEPAVLKVVSRYLTITDAKVEHATPTPYPSGGYGLPINHVPPHTQWEMRR